MQYDILNKEECDEILSSLKDEWKDTTITITRNGISDTLEFDKSDIVEIKESEE